MTVVSDTSPLNYLALIGKGELLPRLYGHILIPRAVLRELQAAETPQIVHDWLTVFPPWLEVRPISSGSEPALDYLGAGERETILLARELRADLVLIDDREGREEADKLGLTVTGTLGILVDAAESKLIDLPETISHLQNTSFRAHPRLLKALLDRYGRKPV